MTFLEFLGINWREIFPAIGAEIVFTLAAAVCGAIVGSERERHEKPAGLRTLMLVCLGSATFTMASFIFNSATGDSGRVAAQIVTGVGFLGAGVILHGRGTVSGTTTAATIWMTAAIGMIAGCGYVAAALGLSVLVRGVLIGGRRFENRAVDKADETKAELEFEQRQGRTRVRLERILVDYELGTVEAKWAGAPETDTGTLRLRLRMPRRQLRELLDSLVSVEAVRSIRESQSERFKT